MKQYAVIGLGRFGTSVAKTLYKAGYEVMAIDTNEDRVQEMMDEVTHAVQADAIEEDTLKELGIRNFDVAIVAIGHDIQSSILTTVMLKEVGVKYVVAKAQNELHGKVLSKVGADKVVYPERDMGIRVANNLVSSKLLDHIEISPEYSILEIAAPERLVGKTLIQTNLRAKFGVTVMAIKRGKEMIVSPKASELIQTDDILLAIGKVEKLANLEGED
jgi:trk system potassium uptake protein